MLGGWVLSSGWGWGHSKAYLRQANNYVYMKYSYYFVFFVIKWSELNLSVNTPVHIL